MTPEGRTPSPTSLPVALTVAGSDSGGGAGIQADLKTMEATGAYAASVLTAVTAQNTTGVAGSHVLPVAEIQAQYEAVTSDLDVRAAKTGMLATAEIVQTVARWTREARFPVVVDPVMVAESGDRLLAADAEAAYEELVAAATLVTPNAAETAVLTGIEPETPDEQAAAGEQLLNMGAGAALVTGGHAGGEAVHDTLVTPDTTETFSHPRIATSATHGSGCALSASIAARLARGDDLHEAVAGATAFMERAVRYAHDVGDGPGAVHHLVDLRNDAAREQTREAIAALADLLADRDIHGIVGATPYAESADSILHTDDAPTGVGIDDLAGTLLAVREVAPAMRFAVETPSRVADAAGAVVPVTDHPEQGRFDADAAAIVSEEAVRFVGTDPGVVAEAVRDAFDTVD